MEKNVKIYWYFFARHAFKETLAPPHLMVDHSVMRLA
jgi:hypothetical protein